jgi:hypothetical protein
LKRLKDSLNNLNNVFVCLQKSNIFCLKKYHKAGVFQPLFCKLIKLIELLIFCDTTHAKAERLGVAVAAGVHAAAAEGQAARVASIVVRTAPIVAVAADKAQRPTAVVA